MFRLFLVIFWGIFNTRELLFCSNMSTKAVRNKYLKILGYSNINEYYVCVEAKFIANNTL